MGRDRAAYMREYRKRRGERAVETLGSKHAAARILALEEEVRHLKAELAKRPQDTEDLLYDTHAANRDRPFNSPFNTHPFTPVPKKRG